jgi:alpha-glucosidase (family GH31 glycosyl hydrolase)
VLGPWFQASGSLAERTAQVRTLRDADAPLSVVQTYTHYLPCGDHVGRADAERALTAAMHDAGAAVTTYFNPMICTSHPRFADAAAAGALTRTRDGAPYVYDYSGAKTFQVGQFDFFNRPGRRFYHQLLQEAVDVGYDGWMEDFGEYDPVDGFTADGRDGAATHNLYPVAYHCAAWDFARRADRPIVRFQRSGWTGVARCAQVVWGGDPSTTWDFDGLASAVRQGLNLTDEMLTRWVQLGAVSGVMRTERDGVALPEKPRPQVEEPQQIANWRRYTKLRTQLYPYVDAAVREYRRSGMPVMRHLVLEAPDDPVAVATDDAFLFGPDLLAAPVVTPGATDRAVHLPRGGWIDLWRAATFDSASGALVLGAATVIAGPASVVVPAPHEELPLLVRAGAVLPLLPPDVDTLADYGTGADLVHLRDRRDVLHLLAFPRGRSDRRFGRHGRLRSIEGDGRWDLVVRGDDVRRFELQASLTTLTTPFTPCAVRWRGRALGADRWHHDPATGVLRASLAGARGRLSVTACAR